MLIYSPLPFIGRNEERQAFHVMQEISAEPTWLMWVKGPAGQGKSRLLEEFIKEGNKEKFTHSGLIDFFDDDLRTRPGLMLELARRFGKEENVGYQVALHRYQQEQRKGNAVERTALERREQELEDALVQAIRPSHKGKIKPRFIFLDTVELIAHASLGAWFFGKFLPRLYPHFRVVAAGRELPDIPVNIDPWPGKTPLFFDLARTEAKLTLAEVRAYFATRGHLPTLEAAIEPVYRHTQRPGQPLLIALACKALEDGEIDAGEIAGLSEKEFDSKLVIEPVRLNSPQSRVILYLAHVYHGFDAETLASIYPLTSLPGFSSHQAFLEHLTSLPYIKYNPDTGIVRLHDYYRERLNREVWPDWDTGGTNRLSLSSRLVTRLKERKQNLQDQPDTDKTVELDTVRQQWLYHLLFANREKAYGELWELLDTSWHAYKYDYMGVILEMVHEVNQILQPTGKFDPILDHSEKAARAWMNLETWKTEEALELAEAVVAIPASVERLYLSALAVKGTALGRMGRIDESITVLEEAYDRYAALLKLVEAAEAGDADAREKLSGEHGMATAHGIRPERYLILNTIGFLERGRSNFDKAEKAFQISFDLSIAEGHKRWQASAATQLGTIARYKGNMAQAYDYIEMGLTLRQQLGQPEQVAFSLQALGMLQRDNNLFLQARESFEKAYEIWVGAKAEADVASALRNLGWVDYLEKKYDDALKKYDQAERIYYKLNIRRELPSLLHKQGSLWIAWAREAKDRQVQLECLQRAEIYSSQGVQLGKIHSQPLYAVLCLVDLCTIMMLRGEYGRIPQLTTEVRQFEAQKYRFEPAYADLEQVLGEVALRQANIGQPNFNQALFDEAVDHYFKMYVYLVHHDPRRYQDRREFLRRWLPGLPEVLRHRAIERLIEAWRQAGLEEVHPGFIRTAVLWRRS